MGFILDGLETESYDRQYSDRDLLDRIVSYFRPYRGRMVMIAAMITGNSLMGALGPIVIARAVGLLETNTTVVTMALIALGVSLVGASAWVFNYIRQMFSARVTSNVVLQLREDVFNATVRHDMSFYDEHPSGKIVSRVTSDTQDFAEVVNLTLNMLSQLLLVVILIVYLLTVNASLTLLLIAMAPFAAAIALSFRRVARRVTQNARRVTATINAQIQESISGILVAKSFRQEPAIYATFDANNKQGYRVGLTRGLTLSGIFPLMGLASGLGTAIAVFVGGLATRGTLSPAEWYLFMQTVGFFWFPVTSIASFWSQFQDGLSAAERVFALIDREPRVMQLGNEPVGPRPQAQGSRGAGGQGSGGSPLLPFSPAPLRPNETPAAPPTRGHIAFRHVRFSYTDREVVLPDFSLDIRAGETVALVGHTGAGKSSIGKLITRFYEFQGGEILLDGRDIRRLDLGQYRRQIGLVPQEPFLFAGSVADNIRYGRPEASDDEVLAAARSISGGEWLASLPGGLATDVGERGGSLSMGQRQLVALARVVMKDPAIFILDEATASVDPFTESQIQEGLQEIMRDRTSLVIAHRLFTVRHADRIIVLRDGHIIEEGKHEELLAGGGHYAELYNTYFRHQSLEYVEQRVWESDSQ
ncbi:ABC transporter related [Candidatus Promineifilum breve]|uniref:ABC transporter related n=1 Tax=Candidatus Promineifilum breve TaxID=1806508 RepID=A0A160T204_9CHLR|nr:ABC transporter ATP-binding protein [Candidatus Promineifilum breve]CUS03654.2 ABC transporter related [Candidatus Promineifilum breve]